MNELIKLFWECYEEQKTCAGELKCYNFYKTAFNLMKKTANDLLKIEEFKNNKYYNFIKKVASDEWKEYNGKWW